MNTKKFKTKDYANHIAESYRQDLLESIEQAKAGTLSPSGVEYCLEEIGMLRGTKGHHRRVQLYAGKAAEGTWQCGGFHRAV